MSLGVGFRPIRLRVWSELAAAGANAGPDRQATMSKGRLGVGTHDR